jgi:hypothetical protein
MKIVLFEFPEFPKLEYTFEYYFTCMSSEEHSALYVSFNKASDFLLNFLRDTHGNKLESIFDCTFFDNSDDPDIDIHGHKFQECTFRRLEFTEINGFLEIECTISFRKNTLLPT